jgi:hypothetical protein
MSQMQHPPQSSALDKPQDNAFDTIDDEFFAKVGPIPTDWDEARRYPRYYYRNRVPATVYPPDNSEEGIQQCFVLTRDLSRGGMSLLHNGQLFPGQRLDVVLPGDVQRSLEVQWCKRVANRCYSAGCRFVKRGAGGQQSEPSAGA